MLPPRMIASDVESTLPVTVTLHDYRTTRPTNRRRGETVPGAALAGAVARVLLHASNARKDAS